MTIESELKALVLIYARYDEEKNSYLGDLNQERLLRLDADFIRLINKLLLRNGPEKEKIRKSYKELVIRFHTDHIHSFSPEIAWVEHSLSEGRNDGACFKALALCYQQLMTPQEFKPIQFNEVTNREDLKKWIETLKAQSRTYTERNFYASLSGLLHESTGYFDQTGTIKPKGVRALVSLFPLIFISFGTYVFAEQLFAVYALYFVLLKGGQYLGSSQSRELQKLGDTLQRVSVVTATATTTVLARLIEMVFWTSRQCYETSLQIGSALLMPLMVHASSSKSYHDAEGEEVLCRELVRASQNQNAHSNFQTPELTMIAAPIESYLGLLDQQFFKNWRAGGAKSRALHALLLQMRVFDKDSDLTVEDKINNTYKMLLLVKEDSSVYIPGSHTALAVDRAERVIHLIKENSVHQKMVAD